MFCIAANEHNHLKIDSTLDVAIWKIRGECTHELLVFFLKRFYHEIFLLWSSVLSKSYTIILLIDVLLFVEVTMALFVVEFYCE